MDKGSIYTKKIPRGHNSLVPKSVWKWVKKRDVGNGFPQEPVLEEKAQIL